MNASTLFTAAHKLTRETLAAFGPADYRATFGACLRVVRAAAPVTIRIRLGQLDLQTVRLGDRLIATRPSRESAVVLGAGVRVVGGSFPDIGGSRRQAALSSTAWRKIIIEIDAVDRAEIPGLCKYTFRDLEIVPTPAGAAPVPPAPKAVGPLATERQIEYALALYARVDVHDLSPCLAGRGHPSREQLAVMSRREISEIITELRGEF